MKFIVVFHYMDGETFEIEVSPNDMKSFMASIGKSEVYFNDSKGVGVWVAIDKIRYFHVERMDEAGKRVVGGDPRLSSEKGAVEIVSSGVGQARTGCLESFTQSSQAKTE